MSIYSAERNRMVEEAWNSPDGERLKAEIEAEGIRNK
jgi:hypothetical protein